MAENEGREDSEDKESKTEEPTERRLKKAYEQGNVPISREMANWVMLCAFTLVIVFVFPYTARHLAQGVMPFIAFPHTIPIDHGDLSRFLWHILSKVGSQLLIPLLCFVAAALAYGVWQSHRSISWKRITPKLSNLSLKKGWKRIFSVLAVIEFVKSVLKLTIFTVGSYFALRDSFGGLDHTLTMNPVKFIQLLIILLLKLMTFILIGLGIIAFADLFYQRQKHRKTLMMTRHEVKEEHKETEGSPEAKQRLRDIRRDKNRKRMIESVPTATAVITNPTHYAVAISWKEDEMNAPQVVAKGKNDIALKIREVAQEHKVPIIENPPLARSLYDGVELEQEIQPDHYQAVADIIRFVVTLKAKRF